LLVIHKHDTKIEDALSELDLMHASICRLCGSQPAKSDRSLLVPLPASDLKIDTSIATLILQYQLQLTGCLLSSKNAATHLNRLVAALDNERGGPISWRRWIQTASFTFSPSPGSSTAGTSQDNSATQLDELIDKADALLRMLFSMIVRSVSSLESDPHISPPTILSVRRAALFLLLETRALAKEEEKLNAWWDQSRRFLLAFLKANAVSSRKPKTDEEAETVRLFVDSLFDRGRCEGKEWMRFAECVIAWANKVGLSLS
jgi:hypothetical protein